MGKKGQLALFIGWPIFAALVSYYLNVSAMGSVVIFFVVPCVYLSFLLPGLIKKGIIFSFFPALAMITVSYIVHITQQWVIPVTAFPFRLFNILPVEDPIGIFLVVYFIILFYEYFLEPHRKQKFWHIRMKYFAGIFLAAFLVFLIFYMFFPQNLLIPKFFFWMGFIAVFVPAIIELIRKPLLLPKFLSAGLYFAYFLFIFEIVGLKLNLWLFPANWYVGTVVLLGISIPFEEFLFWILLFAIGVLSYYEPFDDDEK